MQKLHKPLYTGIVTCLENIFIGNFYADKVIERTFKENKAWGSRDRALVAETVYDMVRHWRLLHALLDKDYAKTQKENFELLVQCYFFYIKKTAYAFDWKSKLNEEEITTRTKTLQSNPAVWYSIADWMYTKGEAECEQWLNEVKALNQQALPVLRVNVLKTNLHKVEQALQAENIPYALSTLSPNAILLHKRFAIFSHPLFKEGLIEVQDEGSQCISDFCGVKPGMRVIDACAGAGGKTLQLAAHMQNKGRLIAMDVEGYKLEELKKRARRAGAFNIEPRVIEGQKTIKKLANSADVVLLDVPCSGTGVLRRNPDAKWKLKPEFVTEIQQTQFEILSSYSQMVKPGGTLIYSTCSLFTSENKSQVNHFLEENKSFSLVNEQMLTPYKNGTDGFYMAKLQKTNA